MGVTISQFKEIAENGMAKMLAVTSGLSCEMKKDANEAERGREQSQFLFRYEHPALDG